MKRRRTNCSSFLILFSYYLLGDDMMNKQGIWFLTLFSLILVLGVYYVTMPNDLFLTNNGVVDADVSNTEDVIVEKNESDYITTLKIELEDKREEMMRKLEEKLNEDCTTEEKNEAYNSIKNIAVYKGLEETITSKILKQFNSNSFVEVDEDTVFIVLEKDKHDVSFANDVMRIAQEEFEKKVSITVKFC